MSQIFGVDFDGTTVSQARAYDDLETPLQFIPGAREGLEALKRAGHTLVLVSARNNLALRRDPNLDPLVWAGKRRVRPNQQSLNEARWEQMLAFVEKELPGIFDAIDDGRVGKYSCDLMLDDRVVRVGAGQLAMTWAQIARIYGEPGQPLFQRRVRR